jgi:4-hydroxy-3-methylbut-2-enyl diphosphate reductase
MKIILDPNAGFCPGVKKVIQTAEEYLEKNTTLYALGELIHNNKETERLENIGLQVIDYSFMQEKKNQDSTILIRAHGEPPSTFKIAKNNNISIIDGTCPIVVKSQKLANLYYQNGYQIVIIGKEKHPEVIAINGYCNNEAVIVFNESDLEKIKTKNKIFVMAQTTISEKIYNNLIYLMKEKGMDITVKNTICKYIRGRDRQIQDFAKNCNVLIMVGGKHSSNTKVLFEVCKESNPRSYWIADSKEINPIWFNKEDTVGITGSASTPDWLMIQVQSELKKIF